MKDCLVAFLKSFLIAFITFSPFFVILLGMVSMWGFENIICWITMIWLAFLGYFFIDDDPGVFYGVPSMIIIILGLFTLICNWGYI
jgi:hypothetical protein